MSKTTVPAGGITDGTLTSAKLDQDGAFTFNEGSADVDFRVESNGKTHALFVDGGNDKVGIGIVAGVPDAMLHIQTDGAGQAPNAAADELCLEGSANVGMSILSGNDSAGRIYFGDNGDDDIGQIRYNHDDNSMNFKVNALADSLKIDSAGHVTKPLQPCFFAYKNASQAISNTSNNDIVFQLERFDLNANFASNTFTAPVTGKYHLSASVGYVNANASGTVMVYFNISNAEILGHRRDASGDDSVYGTAQMSVVIDMDANDTAKLHIDSSNDDDYTVESDVYRTYFSGYLVA